MAGMNGESPPAPARRSLDQFAAALARLVITLRWGLVPALIAIAVLIGGHAQTLVYSNNYRVFFSETNPELINFENLQATYTKTDSLIFVVRNRDGGDVFTREALTAVAELTEEAWRLPYVTRVDSVTNFQYTYADGDELIVEPLVEAPATRSDAFLAARRDAALAEPLIAGQLLTRDHDATLVFAQLYFPERSIDEVPEAAAAARAAQAAFAERHPDLEIFLSGTAMLNTAFAEAVQNDFRTLIPIMVALIIVTTIIAVRSISATLAVMVLVVLSVLVAMGWAGYSGIALSGPSPSAVIVILTLAIADSIHILMSVRKAMRDGLDKRNAIIEAMRVNFLAVAITSVTTIVGFLSLNFSDSPPFRDFGNISAVGILAAWFLSVFFLPAALAIAPLRFQKRAGGEDGGAMRALADFTIRARWPLLAVGAGAIGLLVAQIPSLQLNDSFRLYFDDRMAFRAETDEIVKDFGFYPIEFSLEAGAPGGVTDPEFLETLEAFGAWLRARDDVAHVYSLADIMKRLNRNLHGDDAAYDRLPTDADLSAQYLLLFELSLPYGLDLNDRVNIDKSATRVTATLVGDADTQDIRALLDDAQAWLAENAPSTVSAPATGSPVMFTFIAKRNVESMILGAGIAAIAIALIMMAALRSVSLGLLSLAPNALPILAGFGVWALWKGEIGFSVAAVASLSFGIVIDDTVHFLTKYRGGLRDKDLDSRAAIRRAFELVGPAILVNSAILLAGFLVLTLSAFKINVELGALTSLNIALALVIDFLLLPGLLLMFARRRPIGSDRKTGSLE